MNSQKRLLLTLKYLWEKTDEEHPATLKEIGEYLQQNGIETTRKTLQADTRRLPRKPISRVNTIWKRLPVQIHGELLIPLNCWQRQSITMTRSVRIIFPLQ